MRFPFTSPDMPCSEDTGGFEVVRQRGVERAKSKGRQMLLTVFVQSSWIKAPLKMINKNLYLFLVSCIQFALFTG